MINKRYEPPEDILKLKELSNVQKLTNDVDLYALPGGGVSSVANLKREEGVGVVDATIPNGECFPRHDHDMYEWLIPYSGTMLVDMGDTIYEVGPGCEMKYIVVPSGVPHSVTAICDVKLVGVTVPADEGYPGARR